MARRYREELERTTGGGAPTLWVARQVSAA
jgi:hypothetical protein